MTYILIICHGNIASALYNTALSIIGNSDTISYIDFLEHDNVDELTDKIKKKIAEYKEQSPKGFEVIIFVDLFGGSCANLTEFIFRKHENINIICGVNLPMLLQAYFSSKHLQGQELINKVIETGKNSLVKIG